MAALAFTRTGTGPPMVLLHGLGLSRRSWDPIVPTLAEQFEVLAVDLPGFGDSEPMDPQFEPHPAALAAAVADLLDDLGIDAPHVIGNSLGGWVALELAHIRPTTSLTLLSPAGLWAASTPRYDRVSLRASRWLAQHLRPLLMRVVNYRIGRALVFAQTHGRPARMSAEYARETIRDMGRCPGFHAAFAATTHRRYLAGPSSLDPPITVAFGSRDRLLLRRQSRHLDQLPPGTRLEKLPGCGHIPMSDDPVAVAGLITASTAPLLGAYGEG